MSASCNGVSGERDLGPACGGNKASAAAWLPSLDRNFPRMQHRSEISPLPVDGGTPTRAFISCNCSEGPACHRAHSPRGNRPHAPTDGATCVCVTASVSKPNRRLPGLPAGGGMSPGGMSPGGMSPGLAAWSCVRTLQPAQLRAWLLWAHAADGSFLRLTAGERQGEDFFIFFPQEIGLSGRYWAKHLCVLGSWCRCVTALTWPWAPQLHGWGWPWHGVLPQPTAWVKKLPPRLCPTTTKQSQASQTSAFFLRHQLKLYSAKAWSPRKKKRQYSI